MNLAIPASAVLLALASQAHAAAPARPAAPVCDPAHNNTGAVLQKRTKPIVVACASHRKNRERMLDATAPSPSVRQRLTKSA